MISSLAASTPRAESLRRWSEMSLLRVARASFGVSAPVRALNVASSASTSESLPTSVLRRSSSDLRQFSRSFERNETYSSMRMSA